MVLKEPSITLPDSDPIDSLKLWSELIISNSGASSNWHCSDKIEFKSLKFSSPNCSDSIAIFLKTISFLVKVPVLSEKTYEILPNSSGIVLFLDIVSGIESSLLIQYEKYVLDTSKFTLNDIGIIAQNRTIYLNKIKKNLELNPFIHDKNNAKISIIIKRYILDLFNSWSKIPIFTFGVLEFILALVSLPV